MLASFSVVPMGAGEGVKEIIAEALAIVDRSGLSYELGLMHTVIEAEPDEVLEVILSCHRRVFELALRVLTNINLDDRKGATNRLQGKVHRPSLQPRARAAASRNVHNEGRGCYSATEADIVRAALK